MAVLDSLDVIKLASMSHQANLCALNFIMMEHLYNEKTLNQLWAGISFISVIIPTTTNLPISILMFPLEIKGFNNIISGLSIGSINYYFHFTKNLFDHLFFTMAFIGFYF
jgi:hypothetical protein